MKTISLGKTRITDCKVIKRNGVVYVINRANPKLKQFKFKSDE